MTREPNRALAGKILFFSAFLMLIGAMLVWLRVIPTGDSIRTYLAGGLAAAAVADIVIGVFFSKGDDGRGRI